MAVENHKVVRVLVADDEPEVRDTYRKILAPPEQSSNADKFQALRAKLYQPRSEDRSRELDKPRQLDPRPVDPISQVNQVRPLKLRDPSTLFDIVYCDGAEAAVEAVRDSLAARQPFAIAFLDMRMPPGPDGVWAATRIRELDSAIELVICTAYSDVDAREIAQMVQPEEKLSYIQKPFHPNEIRQTALSLASKWRAEHRITKLAQFDTLTGLPNREQSRTRLTSAIAAAQRGRPLAVLYLDLDNFKRVNDTLGHAVGDELLCVIAARLRGSLRPGDIAGTGNPGVGPFDRHVSRLGGDEFIVLLPDLESADAAARVAARLIEDLQQPIQLGSHSVVITPSVGIAIHPRDGADVDTLLRHADLAMYHAKRDSVGSFEFFHAGMNDAAARRFAIEGKLRAALQGGELFLQYQPQFDVLSGGVSGMEALLRWNNPDLGPIDPADFIPVAEETGLILEIGDWAIRSACLQAKAWAEQGLPPIRMAVNVSGQQFSRKDFPARVAAIIRETGIDPAILELEITESVVMTDEAASEFAFAQLRALGVSLAIDDFGIGYSSFGRLKHFSVNRLKIDRSFVTSLIDCTDDRAIAGAIIAMSRSLRIAVTAEGVENYPQLAFLQEHACHDAQGYLFSPPLDAGDALELMRRASDAAGGTRSARLRAIVS